MVDAAQYNPCMDHHEAGQYWNENAEAWTKLARAGFDIYRDHLNTPTFLEILPKGQGMEGIDIGFGAAPADIKAALN
jgi:hypothetical protein